jgi:hypothetical protein
MSDHGPDDDGSDDSLAPDDEALLRSVLEDRAALADDAIIPDIDELVRSRPDSTSRRLTLAIAAIAACAVLVVGVAVAISGRTSDEVGVVAASPTELLAELKGSDSSQSFAFELEHNITQSDGGCSTTTSQRGQLDPESGVMVVDLDGGQLTMSSTGGTVTATLVPESWAVDTPLLGFTAEEAMRAKFALGPASPLTGGSAGGSGASVSGGQGLAERFDELRSAASSVEVLGTEAVRGVETTHVVVQLDDAELAAIRDRSNSEGADGFVQLGLLSQDEADAIRRSTAEPDALTGLAADEDQRVDAWIDDDGQVRRLTIETNLRPSGSNPDESTTTYTTTIEAFDHGQPHLAVPDSGVTDLGSLPAEVLRPVDYDASDCGQPPVERMQDCTASAFDEAASGRTVEELVATIPKTFEALITPNAWFEACPNGFEPTPQFTDADMARLIEITHLDPTRVEAFLTATDAVPGVADLPRATRFYHAAIACPALKYANGDPEQAAKMYPPEVVTQGISFDQHKALLVVLADPTTSFCR